MADMIITDLEKHTGMVAPSDDLVPDTTDHDEFTDHALKNNFAPVNYDDRVAFLEANGYELTRANLVDPTLSVRPQNNPDNGTETPQEV